MSRTQGSQPHHESNSVGELSMGPVHEVARGGAEEHDELVCGLGNLYRGSLDCWQDHTTLALKQPLVHSLTQSMSAKTCDFCIVAKSHDDGERKTCVVFDNVHNRDCNRGYDALETKRTEAPSGAKAEEALEIGAKRKSITPLKSAPSYLALCPGFA
ncbi:uncharacterized protein EHS24_001519 [Apiotrichum porosum]|uniref:Uncharacterized protein n=1 Tax=Apiotrichum porosum TaxID=105984 RepID=A0A427XKP7_9TREE|nr:uncharacterized protein EHS24_001519 [Apiotrichum porosum]RSH79469.1 hypothetical protein EHS24_001519 [Apiotrichum porosum]